MVWYQTRFYHKSRIRVLAVDLPTNHSLSTAPIPTLQTHTAVRLITLQTSLLSFKHNINIENLRLRDKGTTKQLDITFSLIYNIYSVGYAPGHAGSLEDATR